MNPIVFDFPSEFESARLLIRAPKPGDGQAVYESVMASVNELKPWLPFAQNEQTPEQSEINVRESYIKFLKREDLRLLVFHKETGQLIGSSGLHRINWEIPKFEIGYWADTRYSGKGYMTEAVERITAFAFEELKAKRVEIRCNANNHKSRAIPERLGYKLEGLLKNDGRSVDGNELSDTCVYAKVCEE